MIAALPLFAAHFFWLSSPVPFTAKALPLLMFAGALLRPGHALIALAFVAPITQACGTWIGLPYPGARLFEQLALAFATAGVLRQHAWLERRITGPGLTFLACAVASAIAATPTWFVMNGLQPSGADVLQLLRAGEFFMVSHPWQPAHAAYLIVVGVLLAITAEGVVRSTAVSVERVLLGLVAGGIIAALLNLRRLAEVAAGRFGELDLVGLVEVLATVRLNSQFDVNAGGSLFVLILVAGLACWRSRRWRGLLVVAGAVLMAVFGVWTSGSRAALLAMVVVVPAAMGVDLIGTMRAHRRKTAAGILLLLLLGTAAAAAYSSGRNFSVSSSMSARVTLFRVATGMWKDAPVAGVGIGTFQSRSLEYGSGVLDDIFKTGRGRITKENAHNYFFQVLAELGLTGLMVFVWLLISVLWPLARGRAPGNRAAAVWLSAGILAFLATSLTGHPQLVSEAVLPFWIVLGGAAGVTVPLTARWRRVHALIVAISIIGLIAATPVRLARFRDQVSLEHLGLRVTAWQDEPEHRYRLATENSVVFVPTGHAVAIPLRLPPTSPSPQMVNVWVDGKVVNRLEVSREAWTQLRLVIEPARRRFVELSLSGATGGHYWVGKVDAKPLQ